MVQQNLYLIIVFSIAILSILVGTIALRYLKQSRVIDYFSPMMFMVAEWQITSIGVCLSKGDEITMYWIYARYVGLILMVPYFMAFTLLYTGHESWISGKRVYALFGIPIMSIIVTLTNPFHGGMIKGIHYSWDGPLLYVDQVNYGAYFWVHTIYCYLLVLVCVVMLLSMALRTFRFYRQQAIFLVVGVIPIIITSVLDAFLLLPGFKHAISPVGYGWMGIVFFISIYRFQLLNVVPIARDKLIESMSDGMLVINESGQILDINPAAQSILRVHPSHTIGKPVQQCFSAWPDVIDLFEAHKNSPVQVRSPASEGLGDVYEVRSTPLYNERQKKMGRLITLRDITAQKKLEGDLLTSNETLANQLKEINRLHGLLQQQVIRDPLTGLLNRRSLDESLQQGIHGGVTVSFLMIDIDLFKDVNDTYGHGVGDKILIALSEKLIDHVRDNDLVYRYGGEEFLIVMADVTTDTAFVRAETLRDMIEKFPFITDAVKIFLTLSIGVATYPTHGPDMGTVIDEADAALYRAKTAGRNRVVRAGEEK